MKERALIILNPNAYRCSDKTKDRIARHLKNSGIYLEIVCTQHKGDAKELARSSDGYNLLVSGGGDGTNHEILNGMYFDEMSGTFDKTLGFFRLGSENDFAITVGIPGDLEQACERLHKGEDRTVDVGRFNDTDYFLSYAGVGFDGELIRNIERVPRQVFHFLRVPRLFRYAYSVMVSDKISKEMTIKYNGRLVKGEKLLAIISNIPYVANGMMLAPDARIDDGRLELVTVDNISAIDAMMNLPKAYQGKHVEHPKVEYGKIEEVYIHTKVPLYAQVDGESVGPLQEISISIRSKSLRVRC